MKSLETLKHKLVRFFNFMVNGATFWRLHCAQRIGVSDACSCQLNSTHSLDHLHTQQGDHWFLVTHDNCQAIKLHNVVTK